MSSLIDDLRAMAQAIEDNESLELNVPGAGGLFAVRYRPPARDKVDAVLTAVALGRALSADEEVQLLVDCCDSVVRADPASGETRPYDEGGNLRFDDSDPRWADIAEVFTLVAAEKAKPGETPRTFKAPESARDCVRLLFRLDIQPIAAFGHTQTIVPWLQGMRAEITARVQGNSNAAGDAEGDATPAATETSGSTPSSGATAGA